MSFFNGDMKITELNVGGDSTGDTYFRAVDGSLSRMGIGTNGPVLTSNGTRPVWDDASGGSSTKITGTVISDITNQTYTASQMVSGLIYRDGMTSALTDTTATAASIVSELSASVGTAIKLCIFNYSDTYFYDLTLSAGDGVTFDGGTTIQTNTAKEYILICTNVTPDSEAVRIIPI